MPFLRRRRRINNRLRHVLQEGFAGDGNLDGRALGALTWTAGAWTTASGVVVPAPTYGAELLADKDFEAETLTAWTAVGGAHVTTNERSEGQKHGGTYARHVVTDGGSYGIYQTDAAPAVHEWVLGGMWTYTESGRAFVNCLTTGTVRASVAGTGWQYLRKSARLATANTAQTSAQSLTNAADFYTDDATLKIITPASMFATIKAPATQFVMTTALTTVNVEPAGLVCCLDDPANPQNYIIVWDDNYNLRMDKVVAGVATNLHSTALVSYTDKRYGIERNGDVFQATYMNVPYGAAQTVTGMTGTQHGYFATTDGPRFDNFQFKSGARAQTIGIIGDSISTVRNESGTGGDMYWTRIWERDYDVQIRSTAVSGKTIVTNMSADCTTMAGLGVDKVVVLLGANDAATEGLQAAYEAGLATLVTAYGAANVLALNMLDTSSQAARRTANNPLIADACTAQGVTMIDTTGWITPATDTGDGLHPNATGAPKVLAQVRALI